MRGWRKVFPNAWYVAVREFRARVRSRSFVMGTVLLAVIAFVTSQAPIILDYLMSSKQTELAIVTQATDLPSDTRLLLLGQLNGSGGQTGNEPFIVTWVPASEAAQAGTDLEGGRYNALLLIDRTASTGNLAFTLRTDMATDGATVRSIGSAATALALDDIATRAGTSFGAVLQTRFVVQPVAGTGQTHNVSGQASSSIMSTLLVVLIFMAIVTYGTWVAMSVAEEKGSRVMELMLNAATPLQLLPGKVLGNGVAGLLQYGVIIGAVMAGMLAQGPVSRFVLGRSSGGLDLAGLTPEVFLAFLILFVTGFLLYALLYAALGSLVSRQEDVQSATAPLMWTVMAGYFLSIFAIQAIEEPWVKALSFVPFFSPYVMLARVAAGSVAVWEFVLAMVLMAAAIVVALVVAARIYSSGVLLYGQRLGLRQILKAARVSR